MLRENEFLQIMNVLITQITVSWAVSLPKEIWTPGGIFKYLQEPIKLTGSWYLR